MLPETISHYRLRRRLGAGGAGEVYLADDTTLSRRVAIKFLKHDQRESADARKRLLREARAAAGLDHPNICSVYEVGAEGGHDFIAMQYVDGETLSDRLARGPLAPDEASRICAQVAEALEAAHEHGIVHRDIKPQNIVVTPRGVVKVLDFGLARHVPVATTAETVTAEPALTEVGTLAGTAPYMAPEQVRLQPVDPRTDIFALGAVLFECLTGRRAFGGTSWPEICGNVLHVDPPPPSRLQPDVPDVLDRLCAALLQKEAARRPESAGAVAAELRRIAEAGTSRTDAARATRASVAPDAAPGAAPSASPPPNAASTSVRRTARTARAAAAAVAAVVAIALGLYASGWRLPAGRPAVAPEAQRWFEIGTAAVRQGSYLTASRALEQALAIEDPFPLAHARLAEAQVHLDETNLALASILHATTSVPDRSRLDVAERLQLDAITGMVSRDFDSAITAYSELTRRLPERAETHFDLGRAFEAGDRIDEALASYEAAADADPLFAPAALRRGILLGRRREAAAALASLTRAEDLFQASGNFEGVAVTVHERGVLLNGLERSVEAQAELERALQLADATENPYIRLQALSDLSIVVSVQGDFDAGRRYATDALDLARGRGNLTAAALIDLGNVLFLAGDLDLSRQRFEEALALADRVGALRTKARAQASLASLALQQDDPDEAARQANAALPYYREGQYRREVSQLMTIVGFVHTQRGELEAARTAFEEQVRLGTILDDESEVARAGQALAETLLREGRIPEAARRLEVAIAASQRLGNRVDVTYGRALHAEILWRLNRAAEAQALIEELVADPTLTDVVSQVRVQLDLSSARLSLSRRSFADASAHAQRAAGAARQSERERVEADRIAGLARALGSGGRRGLDDLRDALTAAERLGDPLLVTDATLALAEASLEAGRHEDALRYASDAHDRGVRMSQLDASWRASHIALLAANGLGDAGEQDRLLRAALQADRRLREAWSDESAFQQLLARPDVVHVRSRLDAAGLVVDGGMG